MKLKIQYRTFNSGGNGGQHGNRSLNAIEASVELPGGKVIRATASAKSQQQNRKAARVLLLARVREALEPESERGASAGWGNANRRVRTYHEPDNRVVDASGFRRGYAETVGRGDLSGLVEERRSRLASR